MLEGYLTGVKDGSSVMTKPGGPELLPAFFFTFRTSGQ